MATRAPRIVWLNFVASVALTVGGGLLAAVLLDGPADPAPGLGRSAPSLADRPLFLGLTALVQLAFWVSVQRRGDGPARAFALIFAGLVLVSLLVAAASPGSTAEEPSGLLVGLALYVLASNLLFAAVGAPHLRR